MQPLENNTTDYNHQNSVEPVEVTMAERSRIQSRHSFIANSFVSISNLVTVGSSGGVTTSDSDSLYCRRTQNGSTSSLSSSIVDVASTKKSTRSNKNDKQKKNAISDSHSMNSIAHTVVSDPLEWKKFKEACADTHGTSAVLTTRMVLQRLLNDSKDIGDHTSNSIQCVNKKNNQTMKANATTSPKKKMMNKKNKNGIFSAPPPPIFMREESVSTPSAQSVKLFFAHQMTPHY